MSASFLIKTKKALFLVLRYSFQQLFEDGVIKAAVRTWLLLVRGLFTGSSILAHLLGKLLPVRIYNNIFFFTNGGKKNIASLFGLDHNIFITAFFIGNSFINNYIYVSYEKLLDKLFLLKNRELILSAVREDFFIGFKFIPAPLEDFAQSLSFLLALKNINKDNFFKHILLVFKLSLINVVQFAFNIVAVGLYLASVIVGLSAGFGLLDLTFRALGFSYADKHTLLYGKNGLYKNKFTFLPYFNIAVFLFTGMQEVLDIAKRTVLSNKESDDKCAVISAMPADSYEFIVKSLKFMLTTKVGLKTLAYSLCSETVNLATKGLVFNALAMLVTPYAKAVYLEYFVAICFTKALPAFLAAGLVNFALLSVFFVAGLYLSKYVLSPFNMLKELSIDKICEKLADKKEPAELSKYLADTGYKPMSELSLSVAAGPAEDCPSAAGLVSSSTPGKKAA